MTPAERASERTDTERLAKVRANYLPAPQYFNLNLACAPLAASGGYGVYLVGSCLERPDYRDVDVRMMLDDATFDRIYGWATAAESNAFFSMFCAAVSLYLSQHSGLPVDFQVQRATEANAKHRGQRSSLGIFVNQYAGGGDATPGATP
jgi:hypothetical protein